MVLITLLFLVAASGLVVEVVTARRGRRDTRYGDGARTLAAVGLAVALVSMLGHMTDAALALQDPEAKQLPGAWLGLQLSIVPLRWGLMLWVPLALAHAVVQHRRGPAPQTAPAAE